MGFITELKDLFEWVCEGLNKNKKFNYWKKIHKNQVPNWVERAGHKFNNHHHVKHHDLRIDLKGDNYIYRIYFKRAAHGRVIEEYYKKKRWKQ